MIKTHRIRKTHYFSKKLNLEEKPFRLQHLVKTVSFLVFVSLICFSACKRTKFDLNASSGRFNREDLSSATHEFEFTVKMKFIDSDRSEEWATAAYLGFSEAENPNNSIQFILMRRDDGKGLVAGYRIVKDGSDSKSVKIAELGAKEWVKVSMKIRNGRVEIALNEQKKITENTALLRVIPYVSVSSGKARFEILNTRNPRNR